MQSIVCRVQWQHLRTLARCRWPGFIILDLMHWEAFRLPDSRTCAYLLLNGIVGTVLSDYLMARAVLLVSPVVVTIGLSLTIPISMVSDMIIPPHKSFDTLYVSGAGVIALGFVIVEIADRVGHARSSVRIDDHVC